MWFAKQKLVKYGENRKCKSNIYVIIVDYVIVFQAYLKLRMKWCVQEKKDADICQISHTNQLKNMLIMIFYHLDQTEWFAFSETDREPSLF